MKIDRVKSSDSLPPGRLFMRSASFMVTIWPYLLRRSGCRRKRQKNPGSAKESGKRIRLFESDKLQLGLDGSGVNLAVFQPADQLIIGGQDIVGTADMLALALRVIHALFPGIIA